MKLVLPRVQALALLERSLRVDARSWTTYAGRGAAVLFVFLMTVSVVTTAGVLGAPGKMVFSSLLYLNFFIVVLSTVYFAGTITEEKEEQTLGLLKMTGLNPISILLGKSTSRLIGALLFVLVQLPFTMLAITLGGVSVSQILAGFCTLLAFLILVGNLGLLASVLCQRTSGAARLAAFILALFLFAPLVNLFGRLFVWMGWISGGGVVVAAIDAVSDFFKALSPYARLRQIMATGFAGSPMGVQFWSNIGLGAACFALAWLSFDTFTRDEVPAAPPRTRITKPKSSLRRLGAGRVWPAALTWKDFHFVSGGITGLIARTVALGGIVWLFWYIQSSANVWRQSEIELLGEIAMGVMIPVFIFELSAMTGKMFRDEVKWKTLPALMILPLSPRQIAYRKFAGTVIGVVPAVTLFALGACLAPRSFLEGYWEVVSNVEGWVAIATVIFFVHLVAYLSLRSNWGLLLAILAVFVAYTCFGAIVGLFIYIPRSAQDGVWCVVALMFAALAVLLHLGIGLQLEKLAGE